MNTFKVDNVKQGEFKNYQKNKDDNYLAKLAGNGIEASSVKKDGIIETTNNLIAAINHAYGNHLPLTLSPDMLWLTIAQGVAQHINNNAEELRGQFVNFEGKKELIVNEDYFQKGSPDNDWPHFFNEISKQLQDYIGKKKDLLVGKFTTTTFIEQAAHEAVLMDAMQSYFKYTCRTCCGIPEITLTGSVDDWKDIKQRINILSEFKLSWWTDKIIPIIDEFIYAAQGNPDLSFWQNIYKLSGGSGGPYISGMVTDLFPYLKDFSKNNFLRKNEFNHSTKMFGGLVSDVIPIGLSKVPFKWEYYSSVYKMEIAAGFTGYNFENGSIVPNIGWIVRDTEAFVEAKVKLTKEPKGVWDKIRDEHKVFKKQLTDAGVVMHSDYFNGYGDGETISIPKNKIEEIKKMENFSIKTI